MLERISVDRKPSDDVETGTRAVDVEPDRRPATVDRPTGSMIEAAARTSLTVPGRSNRIRRSATRVQARLTVGAADDREEREADEVAAQVMRSLEAPSPNLEPTGPGSRDDADASPRIQRAGGRAGFAVDGQFEASVAASAGRPMRSDVRRRLEPAFGADFSRVRIHEGAQAQQLSAQIGAEAFTTANNVFIGRRDFDPSSGSGTELLAHELTHVVQQGGASAGGGSLQRRSMIRRRLSADSDKALSTAARSNPAYATHKSAIDKYPGTDVDNLTLEEQTELNDVDSTWKTRLRTKKRRSGEADEGEQLEMLADLIRARNLAEFSQRTIPLYTAPVGPTEKYTSEGAKAGKRKFYLKKANEQKKKDRNLLRLGVAAPETREYLKEHGFHGSARDLTKTVNPLGPAKDSTTAPKAKTRPDNENALGVTTRQDVKERLRGPLIEVRSTFIGGPILGIRVRAHLFIVYTSRDGQQFYFRGGPDENDRTVADYGPYTSDTIDYDPSAPSVTVMKGPEAEAKLDALVHATQRINAMKVPYVASIAPGKLKKAKGEVGQMIGSAIGTDGENCNRTAWTILDRAGVPTKKPGGKHPGWGKPLGSNVRGENEMESDDRDALNPPIDHVITADEAAQNGLLQTYIDRAFYVKGPRLGVGTKVQIVAEGRGYKTLQLGNQRHFVKKTDTEQANDVVSLVRSRIKALNMTTEQVKYAVEDNDGGWDSVCDLADEFGIDDPNDVLRAFEVELAARNPGDELVYMNDRLDAMTDAQMKEMALNLPRLGHFAKAVGVSASVVLKAVQARVTAIGKRDKLNLRILALAPDALALNQAVNDIPDHALVAQIMGEFGLSSDDAFAAFDALRPKANQGFFLEDIIDGIVTPDMLDDLESGAGDYKQLAKDLGVGAIWLRFRMIDYCQGIQPAAFDPTTYKVRLFANIRDEEPLLELLLSAATPLLADFMKGKESSNVMYKGGFYDISNADLELIQKFAKGEFNVESDTVDPAKIDPATYTISFFEDWGRGATLKQAVVLNKISKSISLKDAMATKECVNISFLGFSNVSLVDFEILKKWVAGDYG